MTKTKFNALEKVFAAEIAGRMHQSRAKVFSDLATSRDVDSVSQTLPGRFPVKITGCMLTHRGRMTFCEECSRREKESVSQ